MLYAQHQQATVAEEHHETSADQMIHGEADAYRQLVSAYVCVQILLVVPFVA